MKITMDNTTSLIITGKGQNLARDLKLYFLAHAEVEYKVTILSLQSCTITIWSRTNIL